MTDINGVGNADRLSPMQKLIQQAAVKKAVDVPIGKTDSVIKDDFYGGMVKINRLQAPVYKGVESMGDYLDYLVNILE